MSIYGYVNVIESGSNELCKSEGIQRRAISFFAELHSLWVDAVFVEHSHGDYTPFPQRFEGRRLGKILKAGDTVIAYDLSRVFGTSEDAKDMLKKFSDQKIDLQLIDFGGSVSVPPLASMVTRLLRQAA